MRNRGNNLRNIRHYVLSLIYHNGMNSVRVPSSIELARMFNVARRTACIALQRMIKEGYLIGRVGIGTFTNPKMAFSVGKTPSLPLLAIGVEDCAHFFFDTRVGDAYARLMDAALLAGTNIYPLIHSSRDMESLVDELRNSHVDGLVLHMPRWKQADMDKILSLGIPVATIDAEYEHCGAVTYDIETTADRLADTVFSTLPNGGSVLYTYSADSPQEAAVKAAVRKCSKTKALTYTPFLRADGNFETEFLAYLQKNGLPSIIVGGWRYVTAICDVMTQFSPHALEQCKLLIYGFPSGPLAVPAYTFYPNSPAMAEAAVRDVVKRMRQPDEHPTATRVPFIVQDAHCARRYIEV